jgi:hypothetical protein
MLQEYLIFQAKTGFIAENVERSYFQKEASFAKLARYLACWRGSMVAIVALSQYASSMADKDAPCPRLISPQVKP